MAIINLRGVPDDLRNAFKAACAAKGQTMTEVILSFMRQTVAKATRKG